jgi:hypothetical protein
MIIDTNHRTTSKLPCLSGAGVTAIIRYYARFTQQPEKRLTRQEAEAILGAGISLAVVHQAAGTSAGDFSHESGVADATYARDYAIKTIGQPAGSAIYFGVDYDAKEPDVTQRIVPYFQAVNSILTAAGDPIYKVGAYGDGVTLQTLLNAGLVSFTWISQSTGFPGTKQFKNSNRWTLFQNLPSTKCQLDLDVDDLNPATTDFGAFRELKPISGSGGTSVHMVVKARGGLRLRSGPGTEFDVKQLLPPGTPVSVVTRTGDWAAVDLTGDGLIDGFAHASFLGA